ncbi:hypothetical protein [Aurantimonas endophytica]|uniref:Flagellar protein FliL n=1 Tax=Aurantimonas endophytica TaxID=1522175 RepID=A0A7W6MP13_9HYPH|nr:hypothetical protein [Aurantimonas endophytica]MBB4002478.1 hypothetical protein [Aurantimonas endophytica]MCO6401901.1 hypothetical protein [Aurantimonas endophytica]
MIKLIVVGLWVAIVALGSSYVMASVAGGGAESEVEEPSYFAGLDYRTTDNITIPMISEAAIQGYILARFVYTIDGRTVAQLKVPPDPFILDEAFRRLYATEGFDFAKPERFDLAALTKDIREAVNARYGQELVREILVEQFDYVAKSEVRNGA